MFRYTVIANLILAAVLAQTDPAPKPACTDKVRFSMCHIDHVLTNVTQLIPNGYVDIDYENLVSIKPGAFKNLTADILLLGSGNRISTLHPGVFSGLKRLTHLALTENTVELIPDLFQELSKLEHLDLSGNEINHIPDGTWNGLPVLTGLYLISNNISTINRTTFHGLPNLKYLMLQGNKIASVASASFASLGELNTLDLSFNELTEVTIDMFEGLHKLEYLYLDNNEIVTIQSSGSTFGVRASAFQGLSSLKLIELTNNKIETLPSGLFAGLSKLEKLYFANNTLTQIDRRAVQLAGSTVIDYVNTDLLRLG